MFDRTDKLVEATMLALQGKLELKENKKFNKKAKTKKAESIDVNVDETTSVSVDDDRTVVETDDATIIIEEPTKIPEESIEAPITDVPADTLEIPVDDTVMPEEIVDTPVETELPTETEPTIDEIVADDAPVETNEKEECKKVEAKSKKTEDRAWTNIEDAILDAVENVCKDFDVEYERYTNLEMNEAIKYKTEDGTFYVAVEELDMIDENKKVTEDVEIEVSDDGKEVEVTTDNGEEVDVKDETPDEEEKPEEVDDLKDDGNENIDGEEIVDDKFIDESKKKVERNLTRAERHNRNMDKMFGRYNKQIEKFCEFLRRCGYSEEQIEKAKQNTGLGKAELWDLAKAEADKLGPDVWNKLNSDTDINTILGESKQVKTESKGILKNFVYEDKVDEWQVFDAEIDKVKGKDIIDTFVNYEDDENNVITYVRIDYNTIDGTYIVNYVDNNGEFHQIDYKLTDDELANLKASLRESKKVEDSEEYLEPRYDSRASFYKKAKVLKKDNGDEELYSYGTHVGGIRGGKPYSKGRFSQTTSRHQKEFFKQRDIDPNKVDVEEEKSCKNCDDCKNCNDDKYKKLESFKAKSRALRKARVQEKLKSKLESKEEPKNVNDLGITDGVPEKEEPVPNTEEAKFNIKSFNEALTRYLKSQYKLIESLQITSIVQDKTGDIKLEATIHNINKYNKQICLDMHKIQEGKQFNKYTLKDVKGLIKEGKDSDTKLYMVTFTNKQNVLDCRYFIKK